MAVEWVLLGLAVVLVGANAVFVAAEFGLVTVDRARVDRAAEAGDRRARGVASALRSLSTQLSGAQLGITVTSLVVGYVAEPSLGRLLRGPLQAVGLGEAATPVAFTLAFVVATGVQMVFGELVPKNLAIARPWPIARVAAPLQRGFTTAAGPLIRVLNGSANATLRMVGVSPQEELASARSPQELAWTARHSGEQGTLDAETVRLVSRSLALGAKTAAEVMTPRRRVRTVAATAPVGEVVALSETTGHSRFPVVGHSADDPVGVVHLKQAVAVPEHEQPHQPVNTVMSPPVLVPESKDLDGLLSLLRRQGMQLAVVVDEYGGTSGVVTLEDLLEELVGEISDEHDPGGAPIRQRSDGVWTISGLARPDEVAELTGVALPEHGEYDTIGGLVQYSLGRIPTAGDVLTLALPDGSVVITVRRMDGFRVDRVDLQWQPADPANDTGQEEHA
ncbi:hemolysin family protein [Salinifilum aidingensis]